MSSSTKRATPSSAAVAPAQEVRRVSAIYVNAPELFKRADFLRWVVEAEVPKVGIGPQTPADAYTEVVLSTNQIANTNMVDLPGPVLDWLLAVVRHHVGTQNETLVVLTNID